MNEPRPALQAQPFELPALRQDARGHPHVSVRAILALAAPLFLNTAVQAVLSLTDTWFIGRLSTDATAAMGATYFPVLVFVVLAGGLGMAVQTLVSQAYGGRRRHRAGRAVWAGLYGSIATVPVFVALAFAGGWLLGIFALPETIHALAVDYWFPRLLGGPLSVAMWVVTGFFNGIGATRVTLAISLAVAVLNAVMNELFMFRLGMGMAGAAWATTASLAAGFAAALALFLSHRVHELYRSRLTRPPRVPALAAVYALGIPMGLASTVDLVAFSLFQLMQSKLGPVDGAATQIAMMMTSIAYMPAIGFGLAGTTLVGQSIGAGDRDWAARVGTAVILLATAYMGCVGILIAAAGPWFVPLFVAAGDPHAAEVVRLATTVLWIAACYQLFDGLNLGSSFCLRGAGDAKVPAALVLALAWVGFVPLAHALTFGPGAGWVDFLPQYGYGALGGWAAALVYSAAMGVILFLRWRSGAWRHIVLR